MLSSGQIVPRLADRGEYIGSESTMYRVLRERGQAGRRGRAPFCQPRGAAPVPTAHHPSGRRPMPALELGYHLAAGTGDFPDRKALGMFFHLYLVLDIWSLEITGWEVHDRENGDLAALVIERAVWAEGCVTSPLTLHADNGSPMKAATLCVTLERLGVAASYSRPRVSNDNPFSEALFCTCKYVPSWPERGFDSLEAARAWVADFVRWYNGEHRHSAIRFVTPTSAIASRTAPSCTSAMPSIRPPAPAIPNAGRATPAAGSPSATSGSTPNGQTPSAKAMGPPTRSPTKLAAAARWPPSRAK